MPFINIIQSVLNNISLFGLIRPISLGAYSAWIFRQNKDYNINSPHLCGLLYLFPCFNFPYYGKLK